MKKLKRSSSNKVIAGVFGGLGEYMEIDPTILRLIGLLLFLITGLVPFVIVYIIAVLIIPKTEEQIEKDAQTPAWKKWWFWIIILLIVLALIPIFALIAIRGFGPIANVNIHTEEGAVSSKTSEAHEVVVEKKEPEKEEVVEYLEEEIIETNHEGQIFADYHRFGRDADELYVWAYISEYYLEDEKLTVGSAASLPLALNFKDGEITTHVKPRDGSDYTEDVRRIFPSHIADKVLNIQKQAVLSSENEYEDLIRHLEKTTKEQAQKAFDVESKN